MQGLWLAVPFSDDCVTEDEGASREYLMARRKGLMGLSKMERVLKELRDQLDASPEIGRRIWLHAPEVLTPRAIVIFSIKAAAPLFECGEEKIVKSFKNSVCVVLAVLKARKKMTALAARSAKTAPLVPWAK